MIARNYRVMKFTTTRLKLPLFMLSRQKLKGNRILRSQFAKQSEIYTRDCATENADDDTEGATIYYLRHIAGRHKTSMPVKPVRCSKGASQSKREQLRPSFVGLPPNLYTTTHEPFSSRKGFGVKMTKKSTTRSKVQSEPDETFRRVASTPEEKDEPFERKKNLFDFNARKAPPTSRFMALSTIETKGPPPNKYDIIPQKCVKYRLEDQTKYQFSKAFKFYPNSKVMQTESYLTGLTKNASFRPGPGRYAQYYGCFCKRILNRIYEPNLNDLILKSKALKALKRPYKKINPHDYFCPLFQNVKGRGHTWLFKNGSPTPLTAEEKDRIKKHAGEGVARAFINRVINPKRETISLFPFEERINLTIKYNSLMKFKKKKTANAKKLAFLSSAPRFKEDDSQTRKVKKDTVCIKPMPNFPVTNIPLDQIEAKLYEDTKERIILPTAYGSAKRPFHFKPLPVAKMLVTPEDYIPVLQEKRGFYSKRYKYENFFWNASGSEESIVLNPDLGI